MSSSGRDFQVNGEALVKVKGGAHLSGLLFPLADELGLSVDQIQVIPTFRHREVFVTNFGPDVPAEVQWMLADVHIRMTLMHFDKNTLDYCVSESMGGAVPRAGGGFQFAGIMNPAGRPLGNGLPLFSSGNHYISLNLLSPQLFFPWRFPSCYLAQQPFQFPLGTERSAVVLNWRAIPYSRDAECSGLILWDRTSDL